MLDKKTEKRITVMLPILNEKQRRLYLAEEAEGLGFGGVKTISELTGMSPTTIIAGKKGLFRLTYG
jgi:DNA-binding MurR/RpiR family transcriptional regulator